MLSDSVLPDLAGHVTQACKLQHSLENYKMLAGTSNLRVCTEENVGCTPLPTLMT